MNATADPDAADPDGSSISPAATARTLGPLAHLERHVPPDWWRTLFGPLYLLTDGDVVMDPALTRAEVDRIVELVGLRPEQRVLDLCCGQGRHALELARRGFARVQGLDRSPYLIETARETAGREGLDVPFLNGDCRELPFGRGSFDAVLLMGNSFGYFATPDDDRVVLREVRRVLQPEGQVLLDLASGAYLREHFERRSWEWIDEAHFVCRERELAEDGRRLVSREVVTHTGRGVVADQFYAERLYDREELFALLAEAGFHGIDFAGEQATKSARGQDLGMMARRFLVTARTGAPGGNGRAVRMPIGRVAVVLGDPRLPDETKLGGVFDEDDFAVIDRLKEALASLKGYRFTYLDDHRTLSEDLQSLAHEVDLVLNLCDEGLQNDPRRELHVPALLEVLGLPYTGAGPQSLAHCYDKSLVRGAARELGIPVARAYFLAPGAALPEEVDFPYPVLVKPNTGDSSIGITQKSVAPDAGALAEAVAAVREQVGAERALLVEEFLTGKDLTAGVLGNPADGLTVLPITEDDYSELPEALPRLCGFEAKWLPDSPYWMEDKTMPAELPEATRAVIASGSTRLFERLGCRDYARFDWRLGADGRPRLLEVNPNPGWCFDGHLAKQAECAGLGYADLLRRILEAAAQRLAVRGQ